MREAARVESERRNGARKFRKIPAPPAVPSTSPHHPTRALAKPLGVCDGTRLTRPRFSRTKRVTGADRPDRSESKHARLDERGGSRWGGGPRPRRAPAALVGASRGNRIRRGIWAGRAFRSTRTKRLGRSGRRRGRARCRRRRPSRFARRKHRPQSGPPLRPGGHRGRGEAGPARGLVGACRWTCAGGDSPPWFRQAALLCPPDGSACDPSLAFLFA